jgi:hypothetical protein
MIFVAGHGARQNCADMARPGETRQVRDLDY